MRSGGAKRPCNDPNYSSITVSKLVPHAAHALTPQKQRRDGRGRCTVEPLSVSAVESALRLHLYHFSDTRSYAAFACRTVQNESCFLSRVFYDCASDRQLCVCVCMHILTYTYTYTYIMRVVAIPKLARRTIGA